LKNRQNEFSGGASVPAVFFVLGHRNPRKGLSNCREAAIASGVLPAAKLHAQTTQRFEPGS
jgi:hypothetical protein